MPRKVMNCQGFCKLFHAVFRHIFLYFMIISFFLCEVTVNPFFCQYCQRTIILFRSGGFKLCLRDIIQFDLPEPVMADPDPSVMAGGGRG